MIVLAIDPGTTTGFACSSGESGAECFARKLDACFTLIQRHGHISRRFADWLDGRLSVYLPAIVVIERQFRRLDNGMQIQLGMRMRAAEICTRRQLLVEEVSAATWQAWAKKYMPNQWVKGDEADALAILEWFGAVRLPMLEDAA